MMLRSMPFVPKRLTIAVGLLTSQLALSVFAQDSEGDPEPADYRLEEIIVTAQKRTESLQDVPISVSAVTGEKLTEAGIENLEDLTAYLPNIHFTESGFSTQVRVRGIGSDNSQGFEQSVGMYIDGIYYGRAQLFRTPMMDMQRAELLRGPQSTLFGKNSIAGALNLTTAQPTEDFEGSVSVSREFEHDQDEVNAVLSGPISDQLRARLAVRAYEEEGYYRNTYKNLDEPYSEEEAARLTLDWTPTDLLSFNLKAERNTFETQGRAIEITLDEPLVAGNATYSQWLTDQLQEPGFDGALNYERQTDANEFSDTEITNLTLTTNYELDDLTLTLVTGQLEYSYDELCDCDFVAAEIINLDLFEDYQQFSQEIRLSSPVGETFEWLGGVFYQDYDQTFTDDLRVDADSVLPRLGLSQIADTTASREFEQSSEAWAIFGRVTWNISDQVHLTLGARYTEEDKSASKVINIRDIDTNEVILDPEVGFAYLQNFLLESEAATVDFRLDQNGQPVATYGQSLENAGHDISASRSESAFNPLVNIEWDINYDLMAYASFTTGFKAGGYDPRSNSVGAFALNDSASPNTDPNRNFEFEEEKATAMEIGLKSTLADGKGELNVALYRTDYDDLQISQFDGGVGFNVGNAEETRVQGLELDGRWLLTSWLTANYGASYLDFEYLDFENGNCNVINANDPNVGTVDLDGDGDFELCDYTGRRGVYTPEYTLNLGLDYYFTVGDGLELAGFIDTQWVDEQNVHVNLDPNGDIDAYTIINARIALQTETWSIALLGKNLGNEKVISYSANAPLSDSRFGTNTHYSFVRRPVTYALEATYKF